MIFRKVGGGYLLRVALRSDQLKPKRQIPFRSFVFQCYFDSGMGHSKIWRWSGISDHGRFCRCPNHAVEQLKDLCYLLRCLFT